MMWCSAFSVSRFTIDIQMQFILCVHLENGQRLYFTAENTINVAIASAYTSLTAFFALYGKEEFTKTLYIKSPKYYIWKATSKKFHRRKQGT